MKNIDKITTSFRNLFRQKMRTFLTIFSIVIGSTMISLVYSIIPGILNFLDYQLNTFSSPRLIEIYASKERAFSDAISSLGSDPKEYDEDAETVVMDFTLDTFTDEDLKKISNIKGVKKIYESPIPSVKYAEFTDYEKKYQVSYVFYYPTFMLENIDLVAGTKLKDDDKGKIIVVRQYADVLGVDPKNLIGKKLILTAEQIQSQDQMAMSMLSALPTENTLDKTFEFEIVGVTEKTIFSSMMFIPFTDALEITKFNRGTEEVLTDKDKMRMFAWIETENTEIVNDVDQKIDELGFRGMTYEEQKNVLNDVALFISIAFSTFGIIAIAVSSLGILNTLIMAVYERTREIGLLKALGASKKDIMILFCIEAMLIGFFGGFIGVLFGFGISEVLNIIAHNTVLKSFETLDLSNISTLLLIAPVLSVVVSVVAGIYPAWKASNLDPVKALKYE